MIKPLTGIELSSISSSRTRAGMTSVSELIPRLIRSYELQAELMQRREQVNEETTPLPSIRLDDSAATQATFSWF